MEQINFLETTGEHLRFEVLDLETSQDKMRRSVFACLGEIKKKQGQEKLEMEKLRLDQEFLIETVETLCYAVQSLTKRSQDGA